MLCELSRISSHLTWLGTHALDIGAMSVYFYCFREREEILKIFEMFSGQRMMTSYIRIGGLALEPPRGWHKVVSKALSNSWLSGIDEYFKLLSPAIPSGATVPKASACSRWILMLDLECHRSQWFARRA